MRFANGRDNYTQVLDMTPTVIQVEVAYAQPEEQKIMVLQVPEGTTAEQAIRQSNIQVYFPEIDLSQNDIGIFSQKCALDTVLQSGDRVEIYRPLLADPKQARRKRALKSTKTQKPEPKTQNLKPKI